VRRIPSPRPRDREGPREVSASEASEDLERVGLTPGPVRLNKTVTAFPWQDLPAALLHAE
jgi:hypothetical protein